MLVRSASFMRRNRQRAPTDPKGSNKENGDEAAPKKESVTKKIVRSASFGRRSKQLKQPAAAEEVEATDIDEMSRSATPDTDHAPDSPEDPQRASPPNLAELEAETGPMEPQLYGWLKKRHHTGSWAKRYFFVDETRGTLGYSKGVKGRSSKPSAILPMGDITRLEPLEGDPCAFMIACPPIHLTVKAVSVKERKRWSRQIELRAEVWKARQQVKMPAADVQQMLKESAVAAATRHAGFGRADAEDDGGSAEADTAAEAVDAGPITTGGSRVQAPKWGKAKRRPEEDGDGAAPAFVDLVDGAAAEPDADLKPRGATVQYIEAKRSPTDSAVADEEVAAAFDISDDAPPPIAASADAAPAARARPTALSVPADANSDTPASARRGGRRGRGGAAAGPSGDGTSVVETVELYSDGEADDDDDDDDGSGAVNSANRASGSGGRRRARGADGRSPEMRRPAPVPLASMMSSDEEDEQDEAAEPPTLAKAPVRAADALAAAASETAVRDESAAVPADEADEEEAPVDSRRRKKITGSFDGEESAHRAEEQDMAERAPFGTATRRVAGVAEYVAEPVIESEEPTAAEADWDTDEDDEDDAPRAGGLGRRAVAPPAAPESSSPTNHTSRPVVAEGVPGIVADENFAEEDWDDEDM